MKRNFFLIAQLLLVALFAYGCGSGGNSSVSENDGSVNKTASSALSLKVKAVVSEKQSASGALSKASESISDISEVNISANWNNGSIGPFSCILEQSEWNCSIAGLPYGTDLVLQISALNSAGTEIFKGSADVTIDSENTVSVVINMTPVTADDSTRNSPILLSALFSQSPSVFDVKNSLKLKVGDGNQGNVLVELISDHNSLLDPLTTNLEISEYGVAVLNIDYTPTLKDNFTDTITVKLTDDTGLTNTYLLKEEVVSEAATISSTLNFSPVIQNISGVINGENVIFTATVTDDQDLSELEYKWKIDEVNVGTTNPVETALPETGAKIKLTVTDASGGSDTFTMIWGLSSAGIKILPGNLEFEKTTVNDSETKKIVIKNENDLAVIIKSVNINDDLFSCLERGCGNVDKLSYSLSIPDDEKACPSLSDFSLASGDSCELNVTFKPGKAGLRLAALSIVPEDDSHNISSIHLSGIGVKTNGGGHDSRGHEHLDDDHHGNDNDDNDQNSDHDNDQKDKNNSTESDHGKWNGSWYGNWYGDDD